jgi:hypothetical protein
MSILMVERTILVSFGGLEVEGICAGIRGSETAWTFTEDLDKFRENFAGIPVE